MLLLHRDLFKGNLVGVRPEADAIDTAVAVGLEHTQVINRQVDRLLVQVVSIQR